jgi:glycosyltransferase involved in cell wall biosynthesis
VKEGGHRCPGGDAVLDRAARNDRPLAIVIHRWGRDLGGGAEEHARLVAKALSTFVPVEILTTCARSHHTWANHFPPGAALEDGIAVRRFPTAHPKRRFLSFALSRLLFHSPHPAWLEDLWLRALGPHCPELLEYVHRSREWYAGFVFYTYLYPTTVRGLPLVREQALLVPTAHDEPMLYLKRPTGVLRQAAGFGFLTAEEEDLVRVRLRRRGAERGVPACILGTEIPSDEPGDPERFRRQHGVEGKFLLYLGRIERSKGVPRLLDHWRRCAPSGVQLLLAGARCLRLPRLPGLLCLGFLSEEDKRDALAAAQALVQPSRRESLSLVVLEAWAQRRPIIADAACAPVGGQVRRSGGGLLYEDAKSFAAALDALLDDAKADDLGRRGLEYVRREYAPGSLAPKLARLLGDLGWLAVPPAAETSAETPATGAAVLCGSSTREP